MMKKIDAFSLIIPIVSVIAIFSYFILSPNITGITGFVGMHQLQRIDAQILIASSQNQVIPEGSIIKVTLLERINNITQIQDEASMPVSEFIALSGLSHEILEGENKGISYFGKGYSGQYNYTVPLSSFGINTVMQKGDYFLETSLSYEKMIISTVRRNIVV